MTSRYPFSCLCFVAACLCGCLTEDNFQDRAVRNLCYQAEECYPSDFENNFSSQNDCRHNFNSDFETAMYCYELAGCEFQQHEAAECNRGIREGSCSEFLHLTNQAACQNIYHCTDRQFEVANDCYPGKQ